MVMLVGLVLSDVTKMKHKMVGCFNVQRDIYSR